LVKTAPMPLPALSGAYCAPFTSAASLGSSEAVVSDTGTVMP